MSISYLGKAEDAGLISASPSEAAGTSNAANVVTYFTDVMDGGITIYNDSSLGAALSKGQAACKVWINDVLVATSHKSNSTEQTLFVINATENAHSVSEDKTTISINFTGATKLKVEVDVSGKINRVACNFGPHFMPTVTTGNGHSSIAWTIQNT